LVWSGERAEGGGAEAGEEEAEEDVRLMETPHKGGCEKEEVSDSESRVFPVTRYMSKQKPQAILIIRRAWRNILK
jgi:hypothetical protein